MTMEDVQTTSQEAPPAEETPKIPDYLASPNAVFSDKDVQWRYGRAPDYTKTRKVWAEAKVYLSGIQAFIVLTLYDNMIITTSTSNITQNRPLFSRKRMSHEPGSLEEMVENLVKNWEVEASFKPRLSDWRTIDHEKYSFAMGGGPPQDAEHMIRVGTYNGIIAPNEYYSPENSDFASSHKTFKRMMPTFAWEVLEVYSGPPRVAFRWRHWGVMKNDYVGFNDKGQKVTAKAHGGQIDIEGVTVAEVDDKVRLQAIQTWMDPLEMFRQIAPHGVVNKEVMNRNVDMVDALDVGPNDTVAQGNNGEEKTEPTKSGEATPKPAAGADDQPVTASNQASSEPQQATQTNTISTAEEAQTSADQTIPGAQHEVQQSEKPETTPTPAQAIVDTAAAQGTEREIEKPESNAKEVTETIPRIETTDTTTTPHDNQTSVQDVPRCSIYSSSVTGNEESIITAAKNGEVVDESKASGTYDEVDKHLESSSENVHPHQPKDVEQAVKPQVGEAVVADEKSEETRLTHEEMSKIGAGECPVLMNRE
ncbi:Pathogen-related protein [Pseudocercospora fuligena]|uniref:Pathogen-related protein n=1 Tax=Pseudocercospora fuligena TaxID=685502 RepID=A0A8H6R3B9_9PEZI|nr:Pathogen-related protein [Pseudocercospora fuligena]